MDASRIKDTKPDHRYVLKNIDKPAWVKQTTPGMQTDNPSEALTFRCSFLQNTCWDWQIFYQAVSIEQHQKEFKVKKELRTYPNEKPQAVARPAVMVKGALKLKPKTKAVPKAPAKKKGKR
jgi:hypothetical protein